jgi:Tfp pilus assembly protein PilX
MNTSSAEYPLLVGEANNQAGMTLLTIMMILFIMTSLGILALAVTGMENKMAGSMRTVEAAADAAESCVGTSVNTIRQTLLAGSVPVSLQSSSIPAGPVPVGNVNILNQEITSMTLLNNPDLAFGAGSIPNIVLNINNYQVFGDIDKSYQKPRSGSGQQMSAGYEGVGNSSADGGLDIFYRIDCWANNAATGNTSRITAVYDCVFSATAGTCQS